jgi:uncharacterized protein YukE
MDEFEALRAEAAQNRSQADRILAQLEVAYADMVVALEHEDGDEAARLSQDVDALVRALDQLNDRGRQIAAEARRLRPGKSAAREDEKPDDAEGDKPDDDADREDEESAPAKAAGAHLLYA